MTTTEKHDCPRCHRSKTSKPFCRCCTKRVNEEKKQRAAWTKLPGTILNIGLDAFFAAISAAFTAAHPEFTADRYAETWPREKPWPALRFRNAVAVEHDDTEWTSKGSIVLRIVISNLDGIYSVGDGHTSFDGYSFDRTGVDDSFHIEFTDTVVTLLATLDEQLARIEKSRAVYARSVKVPGIPGGWQVTPERKTEIAERLQSGKSYSFTPSGFGTGYCVSTRRTIWSTALPAETAAFFGTGQLYYNTLDCD